MISSERILGALMLAAKSLSHRNHCPFCLDHSCPHAAEDSSCHCQAGVGIWQDGTLLQGTHLNVRLERNAQPYQVLCQPGQTSLGKESKYMWIVFCFFTLINFEKSAEKDPYHCREGISGLGTKGTPK